MISSSSSTASSSPATSANVTFGWSFDDRLGARLAEAHHPAAAALHLAQEAQQHEPMTTTNGSRLSSRLEPRALVLVVDVKSSTLGVDDLAA